MRRDYPINDHDIEGMPIKLLFVRYLMASYLYYELDAQTPWSDHEYDRVCRRLLNEWESFEHHHKWLVRYDDLAAGTGYGLVKYPSIVKACAWEWCIVNGIPEPI